MPRAVIRPYAMYPVFAEALSKLVVMSQCFINKHMNHQYCHCEVHSVFQFLNMKIICSAKIHSQNAKVYGKGVMNNPALRQSRHKSSHWGVKENELC
jgi:hypothetical protein